MIITGRAYLIDCHIIVLKDDITASWTLEQQIIGYLVIVYRLCLLIFIAIESFGNIFEKIFKHFG